jgi:hypothetical protein
MSLTEWTKGALPVGEYMVTVIFDGHAPTREWNTCIPKPATAIMVIEPRKQPRLTTLSLNTALGSPALFTEMLKFDDRYATPKLVNSKANCRESAIEEFKEKVKATKHSGYSVKVWYGLR